MLPASGDFCFLLFMFFWCCMLSISSFSLCSRSASSTHSAWAWRQTASRSEASLPCRASIPCRTFGWCIRFGDRGERVLIRIAPWVTIASGSDADENAPLAGNCSIPVLPISSNSWHDLFFGSRLMFCKIVRRNGWKNCSGETLFMLCSFR